VPGKDGKKVFVIGSQQRSELVRYDAKSGQLVPYLGGISATGGSFSRDGKWVAYVAFPEETLWRSKVDGKRSTPAYFLAPDRLFAALVTGREADRVPGHYA